ncbi:hypothetical protein Bca52824_030953 [Brassica carinata]|uniref:Uncharacterized protein n=1 Tax=Brassica carinata TaxID=52824 RepID=A0A8X7S9R1_BRACI|nr:hypothetical protein Bca52824_030953 [Brassica carinata]
MAIGDHLCYLEKSVPTKKFKKIIGAMSIVHGVMSDDVARLLNRSHHYSVVGLTWCISVENIGKGRGRAGGGKGNKGGPAIVSKSGIEKWKSSNMWLHESVSAELEFRVCNDSTIGEGYFMMQGRWE